MEKLFLLDAYALIYRAYYAFIKNPRINSKGINTSAIMGFVNTLEDVLRKEQPTHIGIAFDPEGPTFRHEAYKAYKAQREETPETIRMSVPIIKNIIRAYRIPILEVKGYEADDVIGTLATQAAEKNIDTYMMTPDKDYAQIVSDHVFMYRPKYGDKDFEILGTKEVKEKYKIESPAQVIDLLGLMGDSSDNIPGCPGVGEKTAQKLITTYGDIENLLTHTHELKGAIKQKIETNKEQIVFSKFLATIKTYTEPDYVHNTKGIINDKLEMYSKQIKDLNSDVTDLETRLATKRESLINQYSAVDAAMEKAEAMLKQIDDWFKTDDNNK